MMKWDGLIYVDRALPLVSALPPRFHDLVNILEWCIRTSGEEFMGHYLDDFIMGRLGSGECDFNCKLMHHISN